MLSPVFGPVWVVVPTTGPGNDFLVNLWEAMVALVALVALVAAVAAVPAGAALMTLIAWYRRQ